LTNVPSVAPLVLREPDAIANAELEQELQLRGAEGSSSDPDAVANAELESREHSFNLAENKSSDDSSEPNSPKLKRRKAVVPKVWDEVNEASSSKTVKPLRAAAREWLNHRGMRKLVNFFRSPHGKRIPQFWHLVPDVHWEVVATKSSVSTFCKGSSLCTKVASIVIRRIARGSSRRMRRSTRI